MRAKITPSKIWMLAATFAAMVTPMFHSAIAQTDRAKAGSDAAATRPRAMRANRGQGPRAAADALGMVRWSDIGAGNSIFRQSMRSTRSRSGPPARSARCGSRMPTITSRSLTIRRLCAWKSPARGRSGGVPQHTIQTVREKYAWNESEIGAGLEPGKGTATPAMADLRERLLQLWILPYGVVKASIAAGDKTKCPPRTGPPSLPFRSGATR